MGNSTLRHEKALADAKNKKALVLALCIFILLFVLQCGYYVKVYLSIKHDPGKYINERRGTISSISKESPYIDTKIDLQGHNLSQVFRYFSNIALVDEGLDYKDTIRKWISPIRFYAEGDLDDLIEDVLKKLFERMNTVEGFPGISRVYSVDDANLIGYFYNDETFYSFAETYGGNKYTNGLTVLTLNEYDYSISSGLFIVRNGMTEARRRSVICEELVQSMGLENDSYAYPESLFYQGYNEVTEPNDLDWILFRILYHPLVQSGMNYNQILPVLTTITQH
ncbi:MAG: DUF2927 domain-containing protein [Lachnospiraceae bacterium]|nr:DUF2927 domain-containing protein [Lachnospiraceae bacterium]